MLFQENEMFECLIVKNVQVNYGIKYTTNTRQNLKYFHFADSKLFN